MSWKNCVKRRDNPCLITTAKESLDDKGHGWAGGGRFSHQTFLPRELKMHSSLLKRSGKVNENTLNYEFEGQFIYQFRLMWMGRGGASWEEFDLWSISFKMSSRPRSWSSLGLWCYTTISVVEVYVQKSVRSKRYWFRWELANIAQCGVYLKRYCQIKKTVGKMIFLLHPIFWALYFDILSHDPDYYPGHALEGLYTTVDENLKTLSQDPYSQRLLIKDQRQSNTKEMIMIMRWWSQIMINQNLKGDVTSIPLLFLLNKIWKLTTGNGFLFKTVTFGQLNKVSQLQITNSYGKKEIAGYMAELIYLMMKVIVTSSMQLSWYQY